MINKMTIWGVGPIFAVGSFVYFIFMLTIHYIYYPLFVIKIVPYGFFIITGTMLMSIGIFIWIRSARAILRGFSQETLVTDDVYSICRHPLYGQGIFFTFPGLLMFFKSYILFSLPVFMYFFFCFLISAEEKYLKNKFGTQFIYYVNSVNKVFPKFWKLFS